ncbi:MAG: MarR family transcriptional regulator [Rhodocyclaceae bacterium]|nr:MarR family transcriptional regulator [Rhodocyclaceae bacterium]
MDMPVSKKPPVALGGLADTLGFPIRLVQVAIFKDFATELGSLGVTPAIFSVMEVLRANPGITQSKLAATVRLDRSSVVPMLDKLEKRGIVARRASTTDRRHNHLYLTEAGERLLGQAVKRVRAHDKRMSAALSPEERETLIGLLGKLTQAKP